MRVQPLLAAVLLLTPVPVLAQAGESSGSGNRFEAVAGSMGVGSGSEGVALYGSFSLPAGPGDLLLRATNTGFGDRTAGDLGLLYGLRAATPGGRLWARASAGATWATTSVAGELYNCRTRGVFPFLWEECDRRWIDEHGVALAFQIDGVWEVGGRWALGATWFSSTGGPRGFNGWSVNVLFRPFARDARPPRIS